MQTENLPLRLNKEQRAELRNKLTHDTRLRRSALLAGYILLEQSAGRGYANPPLAKLATEIGLQFAGTARVAVQKLVDYGYFHVVAGNGKWPSRYFPLSGPPADDVRRRRQMPKVEKVLEARRRKAIRLSRQIASQSAVCGCAADA
jgi:hypothetical protein